MATKRSKSATGERVKRSRNVITLEEKVNVLDRIANGESVASVGRALGLNESTIRSIRKKSETIRASVACGSSKSSKVSCMTRDHNLEKMEKFLYIWIEDLSQKNLTLTTAMIRDKAVQLYKYFAETSQNETSEDGPIKDMKFQASKGWFENFKKRYSYSLHDPKPVAESISTDHSGAALFAGQLKKLIQEKGYLPEQVFNADETVLFWKRMPNRTFISKEEKTAPGFKAAKDKLTVVCCGNASGDCFIKPMLVYRSFTPRALKNKNKELLPVFWRANQEVGVTPALFMDWFNNCFIPEVEQYFARKQLPFRSLLLIDSAPGHPTASQFTHPYVEVMLLPSNTTPLIQPMNQGVMTTIKCNYIRRMFMHILNGLSSNPMQTVAQCWKNYNIADCISIFKDSVDELSQATLNACWKNIWTTAVRDSNMIRDEMDIADEVQRIVDIGRQLKGEGFDDMQPMDVEELLQPRVEELTEGNHEGPIQSSRNNGQDDDDVIMEKPVLTLSNLNRGIQMGFLLIDHFMEIDPVTERSLKFKQGLRDLLRPYQELQKNLRKKLSQTPILSFADSVILNN